MRVDVEQSARALGPAQLPAAREVPLGKIDSLSCSLLGPLFANAAAVVVVAVTVPAIAAAE